MILNITNENYGYSVETYNDYAAIGNPNSFRYDILTASLYRTGSIDIFKYNIATDQHDLVAVLHKHLLPWQEVLLTGPDNPNPERILHTELSTNRFSDLDIRVDTGDALQFLEDDYGHTIDIYGNYLAVGCRYYRANLNLSTKVSYSFSGSCVDIYDLSKVVYNPDTQQSSIYDGYYVNGITSSFELASGSFGNKVSMNENWLAVGSSQSGSNSNKNVGAVYMFLRSGSNWSYNTILTGSDSIAGDYFGYSIDMNKSTGSYSGSVIVGTNRTGSASHAYLFEYISGSWIETFKFSNDPSLYDVQFYDVKPVPSASITDDGFGKTVALFSDTIVIGAPTDRVVYEYSGSSVYNQGSFYVFDGCGNTRPSSRPGILASKGFRMTQKSYGNDKTLKNNKLGFAASVYNDKIVVSCPKFNVDALTSCFVQGAFYQRFYENDGVDNVQGQWALLQKNTSSLDWDYKNVYQIKKNWLQPPRAFGWDVDISQQFIAVGAPMVLQDTNRTIDLIDSGSYTGSAYYGDVCGKSYIYNLNNYRDEFFVGNAFYRNGKLVIMTSGSQFEGLFLDNNSYYDYEYNINYKSKQTIYEKQVICTINPGEFNVSTNPTSYTLNRPLFDINGNNRFDFQDLDIILKFIQYKNSVSSSNPNTNWSSSVLSDDGEISLYNYNVSNIYDTGTVYSQSYDYLESIFYPNFDINLDNKIDKNDMNILWKYYSNRLNQANYKSYINPNAVRKNVSDAISYLDNVCGKNNIPTIKADFSDYYTLSETDQTGSFLLPTATSIGLYDKQGNLVCIGKLGTPLKIDPNLPINVIVRVDF